MSSEPLTTTTATTDAVEPSAEKGLLIAMLVLVLMGTGAMIAML